MNETLSEEILQAIIQFFTLGSQCRGVSVQYQVFGLKVSYRFMKAEIFSENTSTLEKTIPLPNDLDTEQNVQFWTQSRGWGETIEMQVVKLADINCPVGFRFRKVFLKCSLLEINFWIILNKI